MVRVERLMQRHVALWQKCDGKRGPRFRRRYTSQEQARREADAQKFVRVAESSVSTGLRDAESAVLQAFAVFARAALDLTRFT